MYYRDPAAEAAIGALITAGRPDTALARLCELALERHADPGIAHETLFFPGLDALTVALADALAPALPARPSPAPTTLVVATRLYTSGGHTPIVLEIARRMPGSTIVLTDLFHHYATSPALIAELEQLVGDVTTTLLPLGVPVGEKAEALRHLTDDVNPQAIFYLTHHPDALAFAGTLNHQGSVKVVVHHADHHPSIGPTIPGVRHLDVTQEMADGCATHLDTPVGLLPLYVDDRGVKRFAATAPGAMNVVTAGHTAKYTDGDDSPLPAMAECVLTGGTGVLYAIGDISAELIARVHEHLTARDIDPGRFIPTGQADDLWDALAELDAHIYLASAPVAGGRTAIEAQGCGYPVIYYTGCAGGAPSLSVTSLYGSQDLGWSDIDGLGRVLTRTRAEHAARSAAARAYYEAHYTSARFSEALAAAVAPSHAVAEATRAA